MRLRYLLGYAIPVLALYYKIWSIRRRSLRVLIFHNVVDADLLSFKRLIKHLASKYTFLSPEQFENFLRGKYDISGVSLVITFDDGFKSNRLVAQHILKPLGIKGFFFIPTDFIELSDAGRKKEFVIKNICDENISNPNAITDTRSLTWQDLEYLVKEGHTVGSHTKSHSRISEIDSEKKLYEEIIESGDILEKKLGTPIRHFAYPFGDIGSITPKAMKLIKKRYGYCFSGIRGSNSCPGSPYNIFRDPISIEDPKVYTELIIEGGLDIIYKKRAKRLTEIVNDKSV